LIYYERGESLGILFEEVDEFLNFAANKQSRLGLKEKLEDEIRNALAQQQSNK
jgi:hypothetical protein